MTGIELAWTGLILSCCGAAFMLFQHARGIKTWTITIALALLFVGMSAWTLGYGHGRGSRADCVTVDWRWTPWR